MLAMAINDYAYVQAKHGALECITSKLAPTVCSSKQHRLFKSPNWVLEHAASQCGCDCLFF
jgi:hypothetical protein